MHNTPVALVVRGLPSHLAVAEEELTRSVLYIPRVMERFRPSARSRSVRRVLSLQWPGYAFLREDHAPADFVLATFLSRHCISHLLPGEPTRIPVSQLEPSRILEANSLLGGERPLPPLPPAPGDLVSVPAGRWGEFRGTVVTCTRTVVVIDVPKSMIPVRADPRDVKILSRKITLVPG